MHVYSLPLLLSACRRSIPHPTPRHQMLAWPRWIGLKNRVSLVKCPMVAPQIVIFNNFPGNHSLQLCSQRGKKRPRAASSNLKAGCPATAFLSRRGNSQRLGGSSQICLTVNVLPWPIKNRYRVFFAITPQALA